MSGNESHKETHLEQMLTQLRTRLLVMCASVGIAVDEACEALLSGNIGRASAVMDGDSIIDALETEIDEMALALLVRHQPVAQDLRFVAAALRMVIDLERIGDEAAGIAERTLILNGVLPPSFMDAIIPLIHSEREFYKASVETFRCSDSVTALKLCSGEDESTQQEFNALHRIVASLCEGSQDGKSAPYPHAGMHAILICRALNRIGGHAANLAEHTYFIARGVNIKHKHAANPESF
jgi:phosphate transport system protein